MKLSAFYLTTEKPQSPLSIRYQNINSTIIDVAISD